MSVLLDSETIVKEYEAKLEGQQMLWTDYDIVLRNTPFKSINKEFDQEALVHWWMNVYVPDGYKDGEKTPYEIYKTWNQALWQNFQYVGVDGYSPETDQSAVRICAYKDQPVKDHLEELQM